MGSFLVYTDGSDIDDYIEATTVLTLIRDTEMVSMGNREITTVYVAEPQGIKTALQIEVKG